MNSLPVEGPSQERFQTFLQSACIVDLIIAFPFTYIFVKGYEGKGMGGLSAAFKKSSG